MDLSSDLLGKWMFSRLLRTDLTVHLLGESDTGPKSFPSVAAWYGRGPRTVAQAIDLIFRQARELELSMP